MANFDAKNIRNVLILGHQSSGKTSLSEALAFSSGLISAKGEVEKKNTISDYLPEEQKRGGSIQTAIVPLTYKGHKINLIDVPGNDDFISELRQSQTIKFILFFRSMMMMMVMMVMMMMMFFIFYKFCFTS